MNKPTSFARTGGSAFPCNGNVALHWDGLSKRDYFAAAVIEGLVASGDHFGSIADQADELADRAYLLADAMLKARER